MRKRSVSARAREAVTERAGNRCEHCLSPGLRETPMAFQITITVEAESQLRALSVREQRLLEAAVQARLLHQPTTLSKAIKRLRPNLLAEFELRVGDLRVLYNVEGAEVVLLIVGRKVGNKLIVKGEQFHGHQDHPAESSGSESAGDIE